MFGSTCGRGGGECALGGGGYRVGKVLGACVITYHMRVAGRIRIEIDHHVIHRNNLETISTIAVLHKIPFEHF